MSVIFLILRVQIRCQRTGKEKSDLCRRRRGKICKFTNRKIELGEAAYKNTAARVHKIERILAALVSHLWDYVSNSAKPSLPLLGGGSALEVPRSIYLKFFRGFYQLLLILVILLNCLICYRQCSWWRAVPGKGRCAGYTYRVLVALIYGTFRTVQCRYKRDMDNTQNVCFTLR